MFKLQFYKKPNYQEQKKNYKIKKRRYKTMNKNNIKAVKARNSFAITNQPVRF